MSDCIFCKLASGEIPSTKLYESDCFYAILDQNPVTEGHTLVISKRHYKTQTEMNEEEMGDFGVTVGTVAKKLAEEFGNNMVIVNTSGEEASQSVPHYHIHLIPRKKGDRLWDGEKSRVVLDRSSGFERLSPKKEELESLASKLAGS